MRGSTLQASALGLLSREHPDGMELHFVTMDGDSCGPAGVRPGGGVSQVLTTVETRSTQLCQDEEELVLRLARRTVEVPVGEMPVELRVREIPPLAGTGSTEPQVGFEGPRVPASETPVELTPGSSMSTAPLLTTGQSITASILPIASRLAGARRSGRPSSSPPGSSPSLATFQAAFGCSSSTPAATWRRGRGRFRSMVAAK